MSAKWRRYKKRSKRFWISRGYNRCIKEKRASNPFSNGNLNIKRGKLTCKHNFPKAYRRRKWKEHEPLVDVFEEKDRIVVVAEFAGFNMENLETYVKDQQLVLSASTSDRKYYKSLILPKRVLSETLHASYKNGVLKIQLGKMPEEKTIDRIAG